MKMNKASFVKGKLTTEGKEKITFFLLSQKGEKS